MLEEQEEMIIYACRTNFCGFLFSSKEQGVKQCPDCGKLSVRIATEQEKHLFLERFRNKNKA